MAAVAARPVREMQQDARLQGIGRHRGVLQRGHCGALDLCTYAKHDEYSYGQYVDYGVHLKLYERPSGHIYPTLFSSPAPLPLRSTSLHLPRAKLAWAVGPGAWRAALG